jgi:hypothetical protein
MEKIKVGVFLGLQTRQLFTDPQCNLALSEDEKAACNALGNVETGYLGNEKPLYLGRSWKILLTSYERFCCSMALKMHFLHPHLDSFRASCNAARVEHGVPSY